MNLQHNAGHAACPLCGADDYVVVHALSSTQAAQWYVYRERDPAQHQRMKAEIERLWNGERGWVLRCQNCTFGFVHPFKAGGKDFYALLYESPHYPEEKWEFDVTRTALRRLLESGSLRNPTLLEIGAGDGAFVRGVAGSMIAPENIVTTEFSEYGRKKISESGVTCLPEDVRSLDLERYGGYFNVVCMFQVLEHLDEFDALFERLTAITAPTAYLFIAVPNDRRIVFNETHGALLDMVPAHTGRWNEKSFKAIAGRHGWEVMDHRREPDPLWWRWLQFALFRYVHKTKASGTFYNRVENIPNRLLRYVFQVPLVGLEAVRSLVYLKALAAQDMGYGQWTQFRKSPSE